jgi:hypothetical protein
MSDLVERLRDHQTTYCALGEDCPTCREFAAEIERLTAEVGDLGVIIAAKTDENDGLYRANDSLTAALAAEREKRERLEALVEAAYHEGYEDSGATGGPGNAWLTSRARAALGDTE